MLKASKRQQPTRPPLGQAAEFEYEEDRTKLARGEVLVLVSSGVLQAVDQAGLRIGEAALTSLITRHLADSADGLAARIRGLVHHNGQIAADMTVLVVKRH